MIIANNVLTEGAGFGTDTNIVTIFKRNGDPIALPLLSKKEVALKILSEVAKMIKEDIK
jgi:phosphopantothenoylcysteine decarboxylase / phosphopantothenate---cysteine ligase